MANGEQQGLFGGFRSFSEQRQDIIDQLVQRRMANAQAAGRAFTNAPNFAARQAALGSQIGQALTGAFLQGSPEEAAEAQLSPDRDRLIAEESALTIGQASTDPERMQFAIDSAQDQGASPQTIAALQQRKEVLEQRKFTNDLASEGVRLKQANARINLFNARKSRSSMANPEFWTSLNGTQVGDHTFSISEEAANDMAKRQQKINEAMLAFQQFKAGGGRAPGVSDVNAIDLMNNSNALQTTSVKKDGPTIEPTFGGMSDDEFKALNSNIAEQVEFAVSRGRTGGLSKADFRDRITQDLIDFGAIKSGKRFGMIPGTEVATVDWDRLREWEQSRRKSRETPSTVTSGGVRGKPSDLARAGVIPPAVAEGTVAQNAQGQRIEFRNGRWQPIQ
jgi:hypothetical protein